MKQQIYVSLVEDLYILLLTASSKPFSVKEMGRRIQTSKGSDDEAMETEIWRVAQYYLGRVLLQVASDSFPRLKITLHFFYFCCSYDGVAAVIFSYRY